MKTLKLFLIAMLALLMIAACNKGDDPNDPIEPPPPPPPAKAVLILSFDALPNPTIQLYNPYCHLCDSMGYGVLYLPIKTDNDYVITSDTTIIRIDASYVGQNMSVVYSSVMRINDMHYPYGCDIKVPLEPVKDTNYVVMKVVLL